MDILIFVIPVVVIFAALWLCKKYNFSILPDDFKGKKPIKFKMPKLSRTQRGNSYKWEADDDSTDDDDSSEDEDETLPQKNYRTDRNSKYKKLGERNMYD
jgi:hypothetical protein